MGVRGGIILSQGGCYVTCAFFYSFKHDFILMMMVDDSSGVMHGDCCEQSSCPYSKPELDAYAEVVRRRISEEDDELFRNKSVWHAAIILREFVLSAKKSVRIFCGHLNNAAYGKLLSVFKAAVGNGVDVKVLTASCDISAKAVANGLMEMDAFRVMNEETDFPHFAVVDGKRYRIETDEEDKSAIVCACAQSEEKQRTATSLEVVFETFWGNDYSHVPDTI